MPGDIKPGMPVMSIFIHESRFIPVPKVEVSMGSAPVDVGWAGVWMAGDDASLLVVIPELAVETEGRGWLNAELTDGVPFIANGIKL